MDQIILHTQIQAPIERCFDLSRSIDLHKISTHKTNEKAIAGVTSGLINLNETVTWQATHLGIRQKLTSIITAFDAPFHFRDEQLKGAFKYFKHDHHFFQKDGIVLVTDTFEFASPFGIIGRLFDTLILKRYMTRFLLERNSVIKEYAETDKWKGILQLENQSK